MTTSVRADKVKAYVRRCLQHAGWEIMPASEFYYGEADFKARRANNTIAVLCSGTDKPLLRIAMRELLRLTRSGGLVPLFVYGEEKDPRAIGYAQTEVAIILAMTELHLLDHHIDGLAATFQGSVDTLRLPNIVSGWARVTPARDPVVVKAMRGNQILAEAVAIEHRPDLEKLGDGMFGFTLELGLTIDLRSVAKDILIVAYHRERRIGPIPLWENVRLDR